MALVDYDNSDLSEDEGNDLDENTDRLSAIADGEEKNVQNVLEEDPKISTPVVKKGTLFDLLPQPANKTTRFFEEDDEFLHKKATLNNVKAKAKITIPSLSEFKDVEETHSLKPRLSSNKKSSLLSILPQPKNAVSTTVRSLVPNVIKQNALSAMEKKKKISLVQQEEEKKLSLDYSDDSSEGEADNDFFSIKKQLELPPDENLSIRTVLDHTLINVNNPHSQEEPHSINSYIKSNEDLTQLQADSEHINESSSVYGDQNQSGQEQYISTNNDELMLDDEAIQKLCGTRGKRRREEIQIVDVNQQEVLAGSKELLLKGLMDDTSQRVSSSKRKGNEFTSQQKRKHQITYLAYQAKANEADLQNQWANNRMTKRQTQSKYGF